MASPVEQIDALIAQLDIPSDPVIEALVPDKMINGRFWKKGDKYKTFIEGKETNTFPHYKAGVGPIFPPPWIQIENCKQSTDEEVLKEFSKLASLNVDDNKRSFCGNPLIYNFFMKEMLKTKYKNQPTLQEKYEANPMKMWEQVCKMDRRKAQMPDACDVFELNRAITFFKPSIAKHIYKRFNATCVLDPCMGWGGRLLGAMSLGIDYIGFDTNTDLGPSYEAMIRAHAHWKKETKQPRSEKFAILGIGKSCLEVDMDSVPAYDLVLTSPPYYDLEIYPHQAELPSEDEWYKTFLLPMMANAYCGMEVGGHMCINISPKMYEKVLAIGFPPCQITIDFLQQKNQNTGKGKQDFIYVWHKDPASHFPISDAC